MYKITFNLISPICFIDLPVFDSILARCLVLYKQKRINQGLNYNNIYEFNDLPIKKHRDGYFLASIMYFEDNENFIGSWKKRWQNKHDNIADFSGKKRKIQVSSGQFKSYDMPLNLFAIKKVCFYFEQKDINFVEKLINNYLVGIGKKVSQGYGWFDSFYITESKKNFECELLRPIPTRLTKLTGEIKYCGWKIPYWLPENIDVCMYPKHNN